LSKRVDKVYLFSVDNSSPPRAEKAAMAKVRQPKKPISPDEILKDIKTKPTVPVWPHYGWAYDLSRGKSYAIAEKGGEEFLHIDAGRDRKMYRAITAPLRKKLGIESA
jgi:hypothetical protein